ncbi:MAG: NAD(P)-dependent glycerol-3-phosphate dehydrogenase [Acidobacteria bacterium]|nr:MAG: NAD(P)-dependent glycerol-3-phosphate dehydrogenase [Acidobacteriota bacterium]
MRDRAAQAAHRAAVLGAGSWGTALAIHLSGVGHDVVLWGRDRELIDEMAARRANPTYLPDLNFPELLTVSADMAAALDHVRYLVIAVPSHGLRAVMQQAAPLLPPGAILVSATKGLEASSLERMSQVMIDVTGGRHPVVVLSGPSFAAEVGRGLPTALVAASVDADAVKSVQDEFRGHAFRLYGSDDVVGVEIGAALKNVIAIAAGIVQSMGLGHNAMSALITRGLAEISRLAFAMGGRRETLSGLSGLGDLVLTCTGELSRNRKVGIELGRGRSLDEILSGMKMVAEGVRTTSVALQLAVRHGIELPIAAQMQDVFDGRKAPRVAAAELMGRPQRNEH